MKTKTETDELLLESADVGNHDISSINVRNTDSVHPKTCDCVVCNPLKFYETIGEDIENDLKAVLDLHDETKL